MTLIDVPEVLVALQEAVALKGADYIYEDRNCVYADESGPRCIVGHVAAKFDLLNQEPIEMNDAADSLVGFTQHARLVLDEAQQAQDGVTYEAWEYGEGMRDLGYSRGTWGQALEMAQARAAELAQVKAAELAGTKWG